jgi:hypothetical protein
MACFLGWCGGTCLKYQHLGGQGRKIEGLGQARLPLKTLSQKKKKKEKGRVFTN